MECKCGEALPSNYREILQHFRKYHPGERDLNIICPQCQSSFSTGTAFQRHWYSKHFLSKRKSQGSQHQGTSSDFHECEPSPKKSCPGDLGSGSSWQESHAGHDCNDSEFIPSDLEVPVAGNVCLEEKSDMIPIAEESDVSDVELINAADEGEYSGERGAFGSVVELSESSCNDSDDNVDNEVGYRQDDKRVSITKPDDRISRNEANSVDSNAASYVLKIRENYHAPSHCIQSILSDTEQIIENSLKEFASEINEKLKSKNLQLSDVVNVEPLIKSKANVFKNIKTEPQQRKYFENKLKVVKPHRVTLGHEFKRVRQKGRGVVKTIRFAEELMYVPLPNLVDKLINHPDYHYFVENGRMAENSEFLDSYMKGEMSKKNPVLKDHPDALRFVLYWDDLEACSPLKSRAGKHKLGAFYLFLDNIPAKFRSNLSLISLLALVNSNYIKKDKYGIDAALEIIVRDLKKFEEGITLTNGQKVYGTLIAFIGDNLGSNTAGGFKEGFTALHCCRFCLVSYDDLGFMTKENVTLLREQKLHDEHCSMVQTARGKNEALSKKFGVNRNSVLNVLKSFHVIGGLPPDIMHDILEGCLPLTIKRFLRYVLFEVKEPKFTLDWLNAAIRDFDFDYAELTSKPSPLKKEYIMSDESPSLHQSAGQIWLLARVLPLFLGQFFDSDDPHYNNLLECLEICRIVFSTEITKWMVSYLSDLIESYLTDFVSLYGRLIPKQHHLTHYCRYILMLGSLINYWCMRCEAKHKFFKNLVYFLGNYKNLPFSLAIKHQMTQAAEWSESLRKLPEFGPVKTVRVSDLNLACILPTNHAEIVTTAWMVYEGLKYVPNRCFICINVDENYLPIFAKVISVVVHPSIFFICKKVKTVNEEIALAAYSIKELTDEIIVNPQEICIPSVMHAHRVKQSLVITVKQCAAGSLL